MKNQLILGDNLDVLKSIESNSIDLIYIDPPFFSNRHYEVIWGDEGEIASFNDRWAGGINHYIGWLYERVEELHRVLKPTGSFYLHCDWHANAYIRVQILDKIFGDKNFVNEIIWQRDNRPKGSQFAKRRYGVATDTIFLYSKSDTYLFNEAAIRQPLSKEELLKKYSKVDERGRYCVIPAIRSKTMGDRPNLVYEYKDFTPGPSGWRLSRERLIEEDEAGNLGWNKKGAPFRKMRPEKDKGENIYNIWTDIYRVFPNSKEAIGYPTQKPEALLERIIKASSNPGDIVLDAFCGGGTTMAVARRLGRKFIGIDQSVRAITVSNARLEKQTNLLIDDVFEVRTEKYDYDKLREMDPFKFETFIIEQFGGVPNIKQRGDGGLDGIKKRNGSSLPIQVKQQTGVGRPQIQNFVGLLVQKKMNRGFFIAFDFSKTAYEYVAEIKQHNDIEIELVKVEDIIEISERPKISLDWSYETIEKTQKVTFKASGKDIKTWLWDWSYDKEKGFSADVYNDYEGVQEKVFESGSYEIAVRATDKNGLSSIKTIKLVVNGGVHTA